MKHKALFPINFFKFLLLTVMILFSLVARAGSNTPPPVSQVFTLKGLVRDSQTIIAIWNIKPGYYLYKDRIHFTAAYPSGLMLSQPLFPQTTEYKSYPGLGDLPVYTNQLNIPIPVLQSSEPKIAIEVQYQGCSASGFCYPPQTRTLSLNLDGPYNVTVDPVAIDVSPQITSTATIPQTSVSFWENPGPVLLSLLTFFGLGLLVAFTPCVLPMIPILSSIIAGQRKLTHAHAFGLSFSYVLGMSITYALAGLLFGYVGGYLAAIFQKAWIIILFSLIFVIMALSLFGLFSFDLPSSLKERITRLSEHQKGGTYVGCFVMGSLATLILSPCVTPALVGALGYISQTGQTTLGGFMLFFMGLGMGTPLILIGIASPKLLPKAGPWMNVIKNILGVILLGVAITLLARLIPAEITLIIWGFFAIGISVALGALTSALEWKTLIKKCLGLFLFVYGIVLIVGGLSGQTSPFKPIQLSWMKNQCVAQNQLTFHVIHNQQELQEWLTLAKAQHKYVLLDFYATWCVSCQEWENITFSNNDVRTALQDYILLRADISENSATEQQLENNLNVVAPPTLIFFAPDGTELKSARIVGFMGPDAFLVHLREVSGSTSN